MNCQAPFGGKVVRSFTFTGFPPAEPFTFWLLSSTIFCLPVTLGAEKAVDDRNEPQGTKGTIESMALTVTIALMKLRLPFAGCGFEGGLGGVGGLAGGLTFGGGEGGVEAGGGAWAGFSSTFFVGCDSAFFSVCKLVGNAARRLFKIFALLAALGRDRAPPSED